MDSIDYFDKRKDSKKENTNVLNEWNSLKKDKKTLEKIINEPKINTQKEKKNKTNT